MIKKKTVLLLLFGILFCITDKLHSQDDAPDHTKQKIGFLFEYGDQKLNLIGIGVDLQVDYSYKIFFAQIDYIYLFNDNNIWSFGFILQSEYGLTSYKFSKTDLANSNYQEYDLGGGFIFSHKLLKENINPYLLVSAGPHYSGKTPERQFSGFMFNSNYDIGILFLIKKNIELDLRTGYRHLSNANLQQPNCGLNNCIVNFGLFYNY